MAMVMAASALTATAVNAADLAFDIPAAVQGKIDAATWRRFHGGEIRELLVLFGDPAIEEEMQAHRTQRRITVEDAVARTLRANRYQQLKSPALAVLTLGDGETRRNYRHIPMALVRIHHPAALLRLLTRREVVAIAEDMRYFPVLAESLPLVGQPPVAQVIGRTGAGTTVAVIDTGINYTRAEFGSCTAPGVPAGCRVVAALDFAPDDGALDDIGHGTQVAGVITGIAPGATLAALDVISGGSALSSDIIEAIDWAIDNKAAHNIVAINMSLGNSVSYTSPCTSHFSNPLRQPIIDAQTAGILTAVASGNDAFTNGLSNPACTPEAISVGAVYDANVGAAGFSVCSDATTAADQPTCFSNSASFLTLLAPGAWISTTGVTTAGTSFSAPMVSGAVAVLAAAFPSDTPSQRLARLTSTGKPVTDARNSITKPRLDLLAAQGPPANNAFAAAVTLSGTSGQASGWNYNATKESGEPNHAGIAGGKTAWWQWTAPSSGTVTLDTHGSDFNTVLAVYTGPAVNALASVASNDDDGTSGNVSGLNFHANSGVTYRFAVDGSAGAQGAITLNRAFTIDPPPSADVGITLTDTPDPVATGATLSYMATVTNNGSAAAQSVVATVNLPAGVTFVAAVNCTHSAGVVTCVLGGLASGQQLSRTIQVTPNSAGAKQAQATVSSSTPDTNTTNNTAIATTTVGAGGGAAEGDVPLPPWALMLLGVALFGSMRRRLRAPYHTP